MSKCVIQLFVKPKIFSVTALYILSNYTTPEKIANMNSRSYEIIRKLSRGEFTMSAFVQLKTLAKNTVGQSDDYLIHETDVLLELNNQLDAKIQEIEELVVACIRGINPPILSIPGIGALSAAIILSEYGDFNKYDSPAKMLSFAGLEPGYFQSGQSEHTGRMVKHGSSHLRYALMNCCLPFINNEPVFAEYYVKKRAEGKPHRVAMTHVYKQPRCQIYLFITKG